MRYAPLIASTIVPLSLRWRGRFDRARISLEGAARHGIDRQYASAISRRVDSRNSLGKQSDSWLSGSPSGIFASTFQSMRSPAFSVQVQGRTQT